MATADLFNTSFLLPDMTDYYYDAPDQQILYREINDAINPVKRDAQTSATAYLYYSETPPVDGYNSENLTYTFSTNKPGSILCFDGDTISIPFGALNKSVDDESEKFINSANGLDNKNIGIRFFGIDAKEIPHWNKVSKDKIDQEPIETTLQSLMSDQEATWSYYKPPTISEIKKAYDDSELAPGATWYNYTNKIAPDEKIYYIADKDGKRKQVYISENDYYILSSDTTSQYNNKDMINDGGLAADIVRNMISKASEVKVVIDGTQLSKNGKVVKANLPSLRYKAGEAIKDLTGIETDWQKDRTEIGFSGQMSTFSSFAAPWDDDCIFLSNGYNIYGQDAYGRCIAAVYIKIGNEWINLNKMVNADTNHTEIAKYNDTNRGSTWLNLDSYDIDRVRYADNIYASSKKFDDREQVQTKIWTELGKDYSNWNSFREYTMIIGDTVLFVPPTSIRSLTQTKVERFPVLRARGSMQKGSTKVQDIVEMEIYFNEDHGINGYPYKTKTVEGTNGKEVTYYMNGLRSLLAQFKLSPFLPIDNVYVNEVLGIDAVALINFHCETIPSFPRLLKCTIQMSKFDYRIYMPEIPLDNLDDNDDEYRNYFAKQFNWPLFRWYYQRLLSNGNALEDKDFLSLEFKEATFGNKTNLIPMKFMDPKMHFYVPNEDHLRKMKDTKIERLLNFGTPVNLTSTQLDMAEDFSKIANELQYLSSMDALYDLNKNIQDLANNNIKFIFKKEGLVGLAKAKAEHKIGNDKLIEYEVYTGDTIENISEEDLPKYKDRLDSIITDIGDLEFRLAESLMAVKNIEGDSLVRSVDSPKTTFDGERFKIEYDVELNLPYVDNESFKEIRSYIATEADIDTADILKDNKLKITVTSGYFNSILKNEEVVIDRSKLYTSEEFSKKIYGSDYWLTNPDNAYFSFDFNEPDMQIIEFMNQVASQQGVGGNKDVNEIKGSLDLVTKNSIVFEKYLSNKIAMHREYVLDENGNKVPAVTPTEPQLGGDDSRLENEDYVYRVMNVSLSMSNTFNEITLQETESFAPQYMGGSDTVISVDIMTTDPKVVNALHDLPRYSAGLLHEYRVVLNAWPIKIESEITKLFGVTDTMIESVSIDTVPNYPGLFKINLQLVSVDRTLRNRETLQKTDLKNFHAVNSKGLLREREWKYEQMNEFLSEAELYPDLELPTIEELKQAGFYFIRYSNPDRKFPDPDFYFTYSHMLMSQLIREYVLRSIGTGLDNVSISDDSGNEINDIPAGQYHEKIKIADENNTNSEEVSRNMSKPVRDFNEEFNRNMALNFKGPSIESFSGVWNVSKGIKVSLMEERFYNKVSEHSKPIESYKDPSLETDPTEKIEETESKEAFLKNDPDNKPKQETKEESPKESDQSQQKATDTNNTQKRDYLNETGEMFNGIVDRLKSEIISELSSTRVEDTQYDLLQRTIAIITGKDDVSIDDNAIIKLLNCVEIANVGSKFDPNVTRATFTVNGITKEYDVDIENFKAYKKVKNHEVSYEDIGTINKAIPASDEHKNIFNELFHSNVLDATKFSNFNIRYYTAEELHRKFNIDLGDTARGDNPNYKNHKSMYLLDPYYRRKPYWGEGETQKEYIYNCIVDNNFARKAFFRICIIHLVCLTTSGILPSFQNDIFRKVFDEAKIMNDVLNSIQNKEATAATEKAEKEKSAKNKANNPHVVRRTKDQSDDGKSKDNASAETDKEANDKDKDKDSGS